MALKSFSSILLVGLASKVASGAALEPRDHYYCTFYTEDACEKQSGSVSYAVDNDGIFQNGGPYFECKSSDQMEMSLISYPPGDSNGENPNHCHVFTVDESAYKCTHLDDLGFTTGDGGYYRLSTDGTCPDTSSKTKRGGTYLTFYNDPACGEQSGSVSYSVGNQGCFENGGAYASIGGGDDWDWHIEQYTGTDNLMCTPEIESCAHSDEFVKQDASACVHLDDLGLHSGSGSYKISRAGCP